MSLPTFISPTCKTIHIYVNASNVTIGLVLSQIDENCHHHRIYLVSRQLVQGKGIIL